MKKTIALFCALLLFTSLSITVSAGLLDDLAGIGSNGAQAATSSEAGIGDIIGSYASDYVGGTALSGGSGGLGDIIGGIVGGSGGSGGLGDIIGGILDDDDENGNGGAGSYTGDGAFDTIYPVITASAAPITGATGVSSTAQPGETVGSATKNPYTKPTSAILPGDRSDGVRWMQWIFIYTQYGLRADGITGNYDEETVNMVKKLQKEKGLTDDGVVSPEIIEKIDMLYYEFVYGTDASARYSEPIATVPATVPATDSKDGGAKWGVIGLIIGLSWLLVAAVVVLILVMRKRKQNKDLLQLEKESTGESAADTLPSSEKDSAFSDSGEESLFGDTAAQKDSVKSEKD